MVNSIEAVKGFGSSLCILILVGFAMPAHADIASIYENNTGVDQMQEEKARDAERTLLNALARDPFNAEIRYNLGTAYLLQKKFDRAIKEFQSVLRTPNVKAETAFKANFNAAIASQEQKNVDQALDFYQAALGIDPKSHEVKVNIELLMMQSQGQGQGQGQNPDQNQSEQNQQGQGNDPQKNPQNPDQENNKPQKGQNFSKDELKKIFEELERQEQKVRALEYGTKGGREKGPAKDW